MKQALGYRFAVFLCFRVGANPGVEDLRLI
jgi:hypothetical protein